MDAVAPAPVHADALRTMEALREDPALLARAQHKARQHAGRALRAAQAEPPLQHAVPVLTVAYALAGLARLFGDPALIEVVAAAATRALATDEVTLHDLAPLQPTTQE